MNNDDYFGNREEMIARYRSLQNASAETIATLRADKDNRYRVMSARYEARAKQDAEDLARVTGERDEWKAAEEVVRLSGNGLLRLAYKERDEALIRLESAKSAIANAEIKSARAESTVRDSESRRVVAGSEAIEWESRAKNAEKTVALNTKAANEIRAMLGGIDDVVAGVETLISGCFDYQTQAEEAIRERDEARAKVQG